MSSAQARQSVRSTSFPPLFCRVRFPPQRRTRCGHLGRILIFLQIRPVFAQEEQRVDESDPSGDPKDEAQPEVTRDNRDDKEREADTYDGSDI